MEIVVGIAVCGVVVAACVYALVQLAKPTGAAAGARASELGTSVMVKLLLVVTLLVIVAGVAFAVWVRCFSGGLGFNAHG